MQVKVIAFHLPQFHRIPENDEWWGEGFTEWTNVKRGKSYYQGHYQPRIPINNNYYDLTNKGVLERQVYLAKKYGISGFCFYHYYFTGRKLLERPVERMLNDPSIDFPFCLCWANQSWGRTWYRSEEKKSALLEQKYGDNKEWAEHFQYLLPFFRDKRYIKKNDCPVFLIYVTKRIPKFNQMVKLWKELAIKSGLPGLYIISMETGYEHDRIHSLIDARVEFEPLRTLRDLPEPICAIKNFKKIFLRKRKLKEGHMINRFLLDNVCSYDYLNRRMLSRKYSGKETIYLGAFPGWDNTPRKDEDGVVIKGASPYKFYNYLSHQIERSKRMGREFVFINAWNEWSEGAYLEPDEKYGYGYLKAVKKAIKNSL